MAEVEVDIERLRSSAVQFDEAASRCAGLVARFSGIVDPALRGASSEILQPMSQSFDGIKQGLEGLEKFCTGMGDRVRAMAENYSRTDAAALSEAQRVRAEVAGTQEGQTGSGA